MEPTRIFVQFLGIELVSYKYYSRLEQAMKIRSKKLLRRTSGVILSFNDTVQVSDTRLIMSET